MQEILVAEINHVFEKIQVATLKVYSHLEVGDSVRIGGPKTSFYQLISSMEKDRNKIDAADPEEDVAIKVDEPVKKGDLIFKIIQDEDSNPNQA